MIQPATKIDRALSELETAAHFLTSKYFEDMVGKRLDEAVSKGLSPWLNRQTAAAYAHCSTSEIDRAADAGIFTRYHRSGTPLFRRDEIDSAILKGEWKKP